MRATTRLALLLAAAAAAGACSDESADPTKSARAGSASAGGDGALVTRDATATAFVAGPGGRQRGESHEPTDADEPTAGELDDVARLTRAVVTLNVESESAINRTLLEFGAGVAYRDEAAARRVVETLAALARNERAVVRRGAIALLGRVPPRLLVGDPFSAAMLDVDAGVRRQAVFGQSHHGVGTTWRQWTGAARDRDPSVRAAVAQSLALIAQPEAREMLAELLADPSDDVVGTAATALCALDSDATPVQAFQAARSPRPNVRCAAAQVLARARTVDAFKQLVVLTSDEAPTVRLEAVWALSGLSDGLADRGRAAVELIAFDAQRRGRSERFEALQGLARVESEPDHERLLAVAEKEKDPLLRTMAARSLALRGDAREIPALASLLDVSAASTDGVAEEEAIFERRTADAVLSDLAAVAPGSRTAAEWRRALPDVEARMPKGRPDAPPQRIAQFW